MKHPGGTSAGQSVGMTVQEIEEALASADGDLAVVIPPQPYAQTDGLGFRVTGYSIGRDHLTLHVQGIRRHLKGRQTP